MGKNIVVCLDGTWNGPDVRNKDGSSTPTNVQKVFESLKGSAPLSAADNEKEIESPPGPAEPEQAAKYLHGVGDATNVLARVCEGATGAGLMGRIVRGYTYLSRLHQPGDQIYIIGFSRGAYTARALAGFVVAQGLLDWSAMQLVAGSEASYSAGLAAWQQYKSNLHADDPSLMHRLADAITSLHDRFDLGLHPAPALKFKPDVSIRAVGVWDTVGALGIPVVRNQDGTPVRLDVFEFADLALNDKVAHGFHAIAVDEQRVDFTPSLWAGRADVVQVLFPGAHADVGGGYPAAESGLANAAQAWMARQLAAVGVLFAGMPVGRPDPLDVQHRPWADGPVPYKTALRAFPPGLRLSQRVLQRLAAAEVPVQGAPNAPYRPGNLTNSYLMLDGSGPMPHVDVES